VLDGYLLYTRTFIANYYTQRDEKHQIIRSYVELMTTCFGHNSPLQAIIYNHSIDVGNECFRVMGSQYLSQLRDCK
jgi:hypothetical protein